MDVYDRGIRGRVQWLSKISAECCGIFFFFGLPKSLYLCPLFLAFPWFSDIYIPFWKKGFFSSIKGGDQPGASQNQKNQNLRTDKLCSAQIRRQDTIQFLLALQHMFFKGLDYLFFPTKSDKKYIAFFLSFYEPSTHPKEFNNVLVWVGGRQRIFAHNR